MKNIIIIFNCNYFTVFNKYRVISSLEALNVGIVIGLVADPDDCFFLFGSSFFTVGTEYGSGLSLDPGQLELDPQLFLIYIDYIEFYIVRKCERVILYWRTRVSVIKNHL